MAKQSDSIWWVVPFVVVLYPFFWLYEKVGFGGLLAIVFGVPYLIYAIYNSYKNKQKSKPKNTASNSEIDKLITESRQRDALIQQQANEKALQSESHIDKDMKSPDKTGLNTIDDPWYAHCLEIEAAWDRGEYDWARQQLQKIAYGMVDKSVTDEQRAAFTKLMSDFAKEDPLYKEVISKVKQLVKQQPGIIQSTIYPLFPLHDQETIRYVLYFANELGDIHRIKKGRSYELRPAGEIII